MRAGALEALGLSRKLKAEVLPAYLVLGSDLYLKRRALDAFSALLDPGWRDFNLQSFSEKDLDSCLEAARTLPMMSSHRIVILEDASKLKDDQWEHLYAYLENPNPRTVFVMVALKLHDARVKKISKSAAVVSAAEPDAAEARSIIERSFQKDGYALEKGVVEEMMDQAGTNLQALSQEVEKLKLFRMAEKCISVSDVAALSNRTRSHEIWDLVNLMASRDRGRLLTLLRRLFDDGAVPLVLLKTLYSHFAALLAVKEFAGKPEGAIAGATGMNSYYVHNLADQARQFQVSDLRKALHELHQTDSALKGSGLPDRLLLEILLIRIAGGRA